MGEIDEALRIPKDKYYVVFIDYRKTLELINREMLSSNKLKDVIGGIHPLSKIIEGIMAYNTVRSGPSTRMHVAQTAHFRLRMMHTIIISY